MKKLLSVLLALVMLVSTVSFAAPNVADVAESVAETVKQDDAWYIDETVAEGETELAADSTHGTLVYEINFDNVPSDVTKAGTALSNYGIINAPSNFPDSSKLMLTFTGGNNNSTVKNGVCTVVPNGNYSRLSIEDAYTADGYEVRFPAGVYYLEYTATLDIMAEAAASGTKPRLSVVMKCTTTSGDSDKALYNSTRFAEAGKTMTYGNEFVYDGTTLKYGNNTVAVTGVKCLQFMFDNGNKSTFTADNLKVYYKPYVTVTFDSGDVSDETADSVTFVQGNAVDFDTAPAFKRVGDYQHIGWSLTKGGEKLKGTQYVPSENTTLYAVWQDMTHDKHGDLLYDIDFEKSATFTSGDLITQHGYVNTDYAGSAKWKIQNTSNQSKNPKLVTEDGNTFLQITTLTSSYPMIITRADSQNELLVFAPNGVYTYVQDIQNRFDGGDGAVSSKPSFRWQNCFADKSESLSDVKGQAGTLASTTYDKYLDKWYNVTGIQKQIAHPDSASYSNDGLYMTQAIYYKTDSKATAGVNHMLADNMKLYYKPFNVDVTFILPDGTTKTVAWDTTKAVNAENADTVLGAYEGKLLKGVSLTENGTISEDIWVTKDTVVYAHFKEAVTTHEQHGELLFLVDFENIPSTSPLLTLSGGRTMLNEDVSLGSVALVNPAVTDFDVSKIVMDNQSCASYEGATTQKLVIEKDETGNTYGSLYGTNAYVLTIFRNKDNDRIYKDGNYTIVYDIAATKKIAGFKNWYELGYLKSGATAYSKTAMVSDRSATKAENTWHEETYMLKDTLRTSKDTAEIDYEHISAFGIGLNVESKGATFKYDNIRVYWKPATVNVTVDMNGNDEKTVEAYTNDTATVLSLDALKAHVGEETENYVLKGFSLTKNGELLANDIWVNEDITIYAVWEEKPDYTPVSSNEFSLRTDKFAGVRFKASVTNEQKTQLSEYGFIVTLSDILGDAELTHDCGKTFVEGKCYDVVTGTDYVFEATDENVFFTAVLYNIPASADNYKKTICARPFTKIGGSYTYGDVMEVSVLGIAKAYRDGGYKNLTDDAISYIQGVLTLCGENV